MLIHVVKRGDTLWSIARLYGVSVRSLREANGLGQEQTLAVGQALLVLLPGGGEKIRSIAVNGYAYPHVRTQTLRQALPHITWLSIFSYGFKESGELIAPEDEGLIRLAYEYKVAPVLVLTSLGEDGNFSTERVSLLLNSAWLQQRVLDNLLAVMEQKGYLALDLDFEYIPAADVAAYAAFAKLAGERLRAAGYSLSVALAPKTSAKQPGLLYEGIDYAALGEAANRVLLMTYEWGYTYGPPMAVAPIGPVRDVVRYAVSEIPPRKIMMGVPNYGYDWALPFERGESKAVNIGCEAAVRLAAERGAVIEYDEAAQSPWFRYWQDGQEHIVWFEDVRSIRAKTALADEYDLLGLGYWSLMRPFRQNWAFLSARYDIQKVVT